MRSIGHTTFALLFFIAATATVLAQRADSDDDSTSISIGLTGGPLWSDHGDFGWYEKDPMTARPEMETIRRTGWSLGLRGNLRFGGRWWSLMPALLYEARPFAQQYGPSRQFLMPGNLSDPGEQKLLSVTSIETEFLTFEILFRQDLIRSDDVTFGVVAGPAFRHLINASQRISLTLIEPEGMKLQNTLGAPTEDDGRTIIHYDGDVIETNAGQFSIKGGLVAEFQAGGLIVMPGLYLDYGLSSMVSTESRWRVHALLTQVDLRFAL